MKFNGNTFETSWSYLAAIVKPSAIFRGLLNSERPGPHKNGLNHRLLELISIFEISAFNYKGGGGGCKSPCVQGFRKPEGISNCFKILKVLFLAN